MKFLCLAQLKPLYVNILVCALPVAMLIAGCGGSNAGIFTPPPVPTATRPTPTPPRPTPTPGHPVGANFIFFAISRDFNGNAAPFKGGTGSFTQRKAATTDGLDATISIGNNPMRKLTISISTAGAISVGQTFPLGVNDAFTSSTGITYAETRPNPAQEQEWATQGGPGVAGNVTVVALSATSVSLRVSGARLSRSGGLGPPAAGTFNLNGDLTVPNA